MARCSTPNGQEVLERAFLAVAIRSGKNSKSSGLKSGTESPLMLTDYAQLTEVNLLSRHGRRLYTNPHLDALSKTLLSNEAVWSNPSTSASDPIIIPM